MDSHLVRLTVHNSSQLFRHIIGNHLKVDLRIHILTFEIEIQFQINRMRIGQLSKEGILTEEMIMMILKEK
jgi:hypothetical protein